MAEMFEELSDVSVELERIGDLADGVGKALSRPCAAQCSTASR